MQEENQLVLKLLTQRAKGEQHYPTELTIDWTGMTLEDYRCLARNALIHEFQCSAVKSKERVPEKFKMEAKRFVDNTPAITFKYVERPKLTKIDKLLEEMKQHLSREELLAIFGGDV